MASVKYSQEHEWISVEGDVGTIGITQYAQEQPGDVNAEPMGKGWFFKLKLSDKSELDGLMDQAGYEAFVKSLG